MESGLAGWVNNSAQGVFVEVEGEQEELKTFLLRLEQQKPPRSFIQSLEASWLDPVGYSRFEIHPSEESGPKTALVLPDIATCPDCLREVFDPQNRRYFYPFTNCTNCGPRFSIIEALPYDRPNTSMKLFSMCPPCQAEYDDPRNRRFHAQPNACPVCGPHLELWDRKGNKAPGGAVDQSGINGAKNVLASAAEALRKGKIVAVKGLGGFHLIVAAHDEQAVSRLRELKHREEKPLALMCPTLQSIKARCAVSPLEERLLRSPEAPIVLLRRKAIPPNGAHASHITNPALAACLAPGNPNLGVMLPYTPLHHLLLALLEFPVVATSGNLSDEPICTDERDALVRLGGIADLFLVHNRRIVRHVDDSIARIMAGRELVLRRARGYAPLPITVHSPHSTVHSPVGEVQGPRPKAQNPEAEVQSSNSADSDGTGLRNPQSTIRLRKGPQSSISVLGVGAHLKNTVALSVGPQVFISQHIGDLETEAAHSAFRQVIADFERLYEREPSLIAADGHPDYLSSKYAGDLVVHSMALRRIRVQHHLAHVLSCMAENELSPPVLGVSWDGTGYGLDGMVWGGEFFRVTGSGYERVAHWRPFRLPGGEAAIREPRRTALGLLYEIYGAAAFEMAQVPAVAAFAQSELRPVRVMLTRQVNSPLTTSVGRLFDAVSAVTGVRQRTRFEGQAAMELEFALEGSTVGMEGYPVVVLNHSKSGLAGHRESARGGLVLDWSEMVKALLQDARAGVPVGEISARFHNFLVEAIVKIALLADQERVVLSGGCFQNRYLTEHTIQRLADEGLRPYWHQRVPPNDGGIALGQVVAAGNQGWWFREQR